MRGPILVVDDDRAASRLLALVLDDFGYEVHATFDAETALKALQTMRPEAIIADVRLPGMSGVELVSRVRRSRGSFAPPIILISAYEEPEGHEADCFFDKPFDAFKMGHTVRDLCGSRTQP
jgi:CheY-like chemotaxis protein